MAWVRIDDQSPRNQKMLKAGAAACWLWVCGIAHCQSQLTDGFISEEALPMIGVAKDAVKLARTLVDVGLWESADGGFRIHDYLEYNQSREDVLKKRREDSERKRATESARNPRGEMSDSRAPRAGVPSHPIPSEKERDRAAVHFRGGGVMAGSLPRDHISHAACSPNFSWCVPGAVHQKLVNSLKPKHGGDAVAAGKVLQGWYPTVWQSLPADFTMGDAFRFWSPRFDAAFASADPHAPKVNGQPEPRSTVPTADQTLDYLRKMQESA